VIIYYTAAIGSAGGVVAQRVERWMSDQQVVGSKSYLGAKDE